jgi:hypothetical protein
MIKKSLRIVAILFFIFVFQNVSLAQEKAVRQESVFRHEFKNESGWQAKERF